MKWYEKIQVGILLIPFLFLFLLFTGIFGRLYWVDLGSHRVAFYDSPSYRDAEAQLKLSGADARQLLLEKYHRGEAASGPGQHALIYDNAYVFGFDKCKEGVPLAGMHVDGITGEIQEVSGIHLRVIPFDQAKNLGWSGDYRIFSDYVGKVEEEKMN